MDTLTQKRFMSWTIVVLVIMNIASLATIWFGVIPERLAPPPDPRSAFPNINPDRIIREHKFWPEDLALDSNQLNEYKGLKDEYRETLRKAALERLDLREAIKDEYTSDNPDYSKIDELTRDFGDYTAKVESLRLDHFRKFRRICRPEQRALLDDALRKARHGQRGMMRGRMNRNGRGCVSNGNR